MVRLAFERLAGEYSALDTKSAVWLTMRLFRALVVAIAKVWAPAQLIRFGVVLSREVTLALSDAR